jgi:AcrR family transcriptional regulator
MVATRAGVGRSSLNRRWKSKAELVLHAILGESPDLTPFAGTDLTGWIDWLVRGSHELFSRADTHAAVPGLLIAFQDNEELRRALWSNFSGPAVQLYAEHVDAATPHEQREADLDARALLTMAAGAALMLTTIAADDDSTEQLDRIAQLLTNAARTR